MTERSIARHRASHRPRPGSRTATAVMVAGALTLGFGTAPAWAAPEPGGTTGGDSGEPGGTTGGQDSPDPGGTTTPPPAPAPADPGPVSPGSPGIVPGPPPGPVAPEPVPQVAPADTAPSYEQGPAVPQSPPVQQGPTVQPMTYDTPYDPIPKRPHLPRPTPDVPRQAWKPDTLTVGNQSIPVSKLPRELRDNPRAIVSINDWSAYGASQIARFLISIGVPKDEATRQAAAAIIGGVVGGGAGGLIAFTGTAILVGSVVIPLATLTGAAIGAGIGAAVPPQPLNVLPGMAIGAGVGAATGLGVTLAAATATGLAAAIAVGSVSAAVTWALGTGDPGTNTTPPPNPFAPPPAPAPAPLPNPGGNQFELHVPAPTAERVGLPGTGVDYVVNQRGDVDISGQVAGQDVSVGWSAEQAQAPIKALGAAAPGAEKAINDTVREVGKQVERALPGATAVWPQLTPPPARR